MGNIVKAKEVILNTFEIEKDTLKNSPDIFLFEEKMFGIDEARDLSEKALRSAFSNKKIFIITPEKITFEAQNALLKTFEEPIADTYFFLVSKDESSILDTLLSRMCVWRLPGLEIDVTSSEKFIDLNLGDRMDFAKKWALKEKNLTDFLDGLAKCLKERNYRQESIQEVFEARLISQTRGVSSKLILEYLGLIL